MIRTSTYTHLFYLYLIYSLIFLQTVSIYHHNWIYIYDLHHFDMAFHGNIIKIVHIYHKNEYFGIPCGNVHYRSKLLNAYVILSHTLTNKLANRHTF